MLPTGVYFCKNEKKNLKIKKARRTPPTKTNPRLARPSKHSRAEQGERSLLAIHTSASPEPGPLAPSGGGAERGALGLGCLAVPGFGRLSRSRDSGDAEVDAAGAMASWLAPRGEAERVPRAAPGG